MAKITIFSTDYFPLSAIAESKALLKSQKTWHKKNLKNKRNKLKKVEKKIKQEETLLKKYEKTLLSLIQLSKARKNNELCNVRLCPNLYWNKTNPNNCIYKDALMNVYLFEVQHLKSMIKVIKNRIKQLRFRKQ